MGKPTEVKVNIIDMRSDTPSDSTLTRCANIYMSGFNNAPWDAYQWKFTPEKAKRELTRSVSTVVDSGGALIYLTFRGNPVGFSIVTDLGLFVREFAATIQNKRLPKNYKSPNQYFVLLSQLLEMPLDEFGKIGYIADVAVDIKHRGKGYGKTLIALSSKYLKDIGKKYAFAWTVNPVMENVLSQGSFKHISGIGEKGEGLDFTVYHGTWYPTLAIPAETTKTQTTAEHYLKAFW